MAHIIPPIWIARTRSFWLGILPAALTIMDAIVQISASEAAGPVSGIVAEMLRAFGLSVSGSDVAEWMRAVAPVYALIVAHQRSGQARPYVMTRKAEGKQ